MLPLNAPQDESARLAELDKFAVLPESTQERFARIVRDAETCLAMPYCMLSFTDDRKLRVIAGCGFDISELNRDSAICSRAMFASDMVLAPDTTEDERLKDHPFVTGAPHIRFYAGIAISSGGHPIGTLCIADTRPRLLTREQLTFFRQLALEIEQELARRSLDSGFIGTTTAESSGYLRLDNFLERIRSALHVYPRLTTILIRLQRLPGTSTLLAPATFQLLRSTLDATFKTSLLALGSFGQHNVLIAAEEGMLNSFANAYLLKKAIDALFKAGQLSGYRVEIIFDSVIAADTESVFAVSNRYNRLLTFRVPPGDSGNVALHDISDQGVNYQNLSSFNLDISTTNIEFSQIVELASGNVVIEKIICSKEFHNANRESDMLKVSEREKLVDYNIELLAGAARRMREKPWMIGVDILMPALTSPRFMAALEHMLSSGALDEARLLPCIDAFSLKKHHLDIKQFIDTVDARNHKLRIGLNTFTTMGRYIPYYIAQRLSYCFAYTVLAMDIIHYDDDRTRMQRLIAEFSAFGLTCVLMGTGDTEERNALAAIGATHSVQR